MSRKDKFYRSYKRELIPFVKQNRKNPTPAERKLWFVGLSKLEPKFYRQRGIGPFIVDFYCPKAKLVIEVDGEPHFTEQGQAYDQERTSYLENLGLKIVRFTNAEVMQNLEGVLAEIQKTLKAT